MTVHGGQVPAGEELGVAGVTSATLIGRGGFGAVYRAHQIAYDRTVAVKIQWRLASSAADDEARSERESKAMGRLCGHPNIVTVFESGRSGDGRSYLLMEYLPGGNLAERVAAQGPMAWDEVAAIGVKLAGALDMAHRNGILHRDVKPENVLISAFGEPKLGDFGIARVKGGPETSGGQVLASIQHAAPEIFAGAPPTEAADLYSLGSTLFHLLAGQPAFAADGADTLPALVDRIASGRIPDLTASGVPAPLFAVVKQAMAKDPQKRPSSAAELADLLRRAEVDLERPPTEFSQESETTGTRAVTDSVAAGAATATVATVGSGSGSGQGPSHRGARRGVIVTVATGIALLVVLGGAGILWGLRQNSVPGDSASAAEQGLGPGTPPVRDCPPPPGALGPSGAEGTKPNRGLAQESCDLYRRSLTASQLGESWSERPPLHFAPEAGSGLCTKGPGDFGITEWAGQAYVAFADTGGSTLLFERALTLRIGADTYLDEILSDATACGSFQLDVPGVGKLTMSARELNSPEEEDAVWVGLAGTDESGDPYQGLYAVTRVDDTFVSVLVLDPGTLDMAEADGLVSAALAAYRSYRPQRGGPATTAASPPTPRQAPAPAHPRGDVCTLVDLDVVDQMLGSSVIPTPSEDVCTYLVSDPTAVSYAAAVSIGGAGRAGFESAIAVHPDAVTVEDLGDDAFYAAGNGTMTVLEGESVLTVLVFKTGPGQTTAADAAPVESRARALADAFTDAIRPG